MRRRASAEAAARAKQAQLASELQAEELIHVRETHSAALGGDAQTARAVSSSVNGVAFFGATRATRVFKFVRWHVGPFMSASKAAPPFVAEGPPEYTEAKDRFLANLDYSVWLPLFFEGLREPADPCRFLAVTAVKDMLTSPGGATYRKVRRTRFAAPAAAVASRIASRRSLGVRRRLRLSCRCSSCRCASRSTRASRTPDSHRCPPRIFGWSYCVLPRLLAST